MFGIHTKTQKKVFVGLSGGVDSAVSAALLKKGGFDVTGVFIRIVLPGYPCPAIEDRQDAMRVAAHLGITFREIDLSAEYKARVFKYSLDEFARGRTPNPDTMCNREIKFGVFFDYCMEQGADFVATGHYAQILKNRDKQAPQLLVSADTEKDQTYFLWMVEEKEYERTLFPVGDKKKSEVRALAQKFGLPNARRKDSQGLCFLGDVSMPDMLSRELHPTPGQVLSETGEVVGTHNGTILYTIGQRHGFTAHLHQTEQQPLYVIEKSISDNTITVSESRFPKDASKTEVLLSQTNWIGAVKSGTYKVRYRYRQALTTATLDLEKLCVTLHEPHYIPEGQSLVLYDGARCVGGGIVESVKLV